ncbi:unnamed protein product [Hapterophycus canaliculatus]
MLGPQRMGRMGLVDTCKAQAGEGDPEGRAERRGVVGRVAARCSSISHRSHQRSPQVNVKNVLPGMPIRNERRGWGSPPSKVRICTIVLQPSPLQTKRRNVAGTTHVIYKGNQGTLRLHRRHTAEEESKRRSGALASVQGRKSQQR